MILKWIPYHSLIIIVSIYVLSAVKTVLLKLSDVNKCHSDVNNAVAKIKNQNTPNS